MRRVLLLLVAAASVLTASAPPLKVLSAGAVEAAVVQLAEDYGRGGAPTVVTRFGTGPEIEKLLTTGESIDVLIAPVAVVERGVHANLVVSDTQTPIARVGVGVAVRHGVPRPDVTTVEALHATLLRAESVVYNQASTGIYLEKLFAEMGVRDALKGNTTRYRNAAQVLEHMIDGRGMEIGFGPITEIKAYEPKGLVLVAALPASVQNYTTYIAAAMRGPRTVEAKSFIQYLATEEARKRFTATGAQ